MSGERVERFGGALEDAFDFQDKVASNVAAFIEPALQAAETALAASRATTDLSAYDAYLRAYAIVFGSAQQIPRALSPHGGVGSVLYQIGFALFLSRRFEEAIPKLLLAIQTSPNSPAVHRTLIACYSHLGRLDEARAALARLRAIAPDVLPKVSHWRNPEHRELYLSGLRPAMGETT